MKRTTDRLTGPKLRAFLAKLLKANGHIDDVTANREAATLAQAIASARVKRSARALIFARKRSSGPPTERVDEASGHVAGKSRPGAPSSAEQNAAIEKGSPSGPANAQEPDTAPSAADAPFDPYAFGLVPVFKREGRDGLAAKLETVLEVDQLRKVARSQQIALPAELRRGVADAADIREAILRGVEKRVADRRAAAS